MTFLQCDKVNKGEKRFFCFKIKTADCPFESKMGSKMRNGKHFVTEVAEEEEEEDAANHSKMNWSIFCFQKQIIVPLWMNNRRL